MIERECEIPFGYLGEKGDRTLGKKGDRFLHQIKGRHLAYHTNHILSKTQGWIGSGNDECSILNSRWQHIYNIA